jgi:hypothetical protein
MKAVWAHYSRFAEKLSEICWNKKEIRRQFPE